MNTFRVKRIGNEQGGARLKLVVFIIIFAAIIFAGYLYIPVAVDAYYFKDVMQNMVNQAVAQGKDSTWLKDQLVKSEPDYHVPPDAVITVNQPEKRLEVRVQFKRPISLPGYTYEYEFDSTVQSTTFLTK